MDQKWILLILLILVFYQKITSGAVQVTVKEGESYEISCKPAEIGGMIVWFRVLDKSGMEFIASFSTSGLQKSSAPFKPTFSDAKINQNILILNSFNKIDDSGMYSCASIKNNELKFGQVIQLAGVSDAVTVPPTRSIVTQPCPSTTPRSCICSNNKTGQGEVRPFFSCTPIILGPLAGACGLLLLLLIIITLYCNKMRTRRCPHHYKRRPRTMAPGKQMTNRHV